MEKNTFKKVRFILEYYDVRDGKPWDIYSWFSSHLNKCNDLDNADHSKEKLKLKIL